MADLDDFFKKRDKKKKTATKSKFSTLDTEELAKNLEATTRVATSAVFESENNVTASASVANASEDFVEAYVEPEYTSSSSRAADNVDDEWKPFDSDENKDYTGLRIKIDNLKVDDENNENISNVEESEKKASCPWGSARNRRQQQESLDNDDPSPQDDETPSSVVSSVNNHQLSAATTATTTSDNSSSPLLSSSSNDNLSSGAHQSQPNTETATSASTTSAYVPPALRRAQEQKAALTTVESTKPPITAAAAVGATAEPSKYVAPHLRNAASAQMSTNSGSGAFVTSSARRAGANKSQPNINDNMEFPSLGDVKEDASSSATAAPDRFDYSKRTTRPVDPKTGKETGSIDLQNKFTALSNN